MIVDFNSKFICVIVLFVQFSCENVENTKNRTAQNLSVISDSINSDFVEIRNEAKKLADSLEALYAMYSNRPIAVDTIKYTIHSGTGVLYKPLNDAKSAVWVQAQSAVKKRVQEIVSFTEPIEHNLMNITQHYTEVAQAYYNSKDSYNRIYPYIDVVQQLPSNLDVTEFNFYFLADEKNNPEKKAVWVNEPYIDPAGRGWMISAIAPVYLNDSLEGVAGLDVTINTITERYINAEDNMLMILDKNGVVVAINQYLNGLFSLPPLKNHKYIETITSDTYLPDDYNLLKSKNKIVRDFAEKIYSDKQNVISMEIDSDNFEIFVDKIHEVEWYLIKVIPKH